VPIKGPALSQTYIASTVVLPQRARVRPEGISKYNNASGRFSRPSGSTSNHSSKSKKSSPSNGLDSIMSSPTQRSSYESTTDGNVAVLSAFPSPPAKQFSGPSAFSTKALMSPQQPEGQRIHQIFTPILPDELRLTRLGECVAVIKYFDDGWCIVSRPKRRTPHHSNNEPPYTAKPDANGVELGAVPAWCFVKQVGGLRSERPIRRSSLGIILGVEVRHGSGLGPISGGRGKGEMVRDG
jgi:hypothetical protein